MSGIKIEVVLNNFYKIKVESKFGAGEGIRTLDFNLGKVAMYNLIQGNN